eukprot:Phypoly_transcript_19981.p1 GENE.Phypoly_transcript_19981~~Phypoly_transcript_19981.p1  ORF type:complete len:232 (+),score=39.82 Phypoly_transcript_19981:51-698(+)
MSKYTTLQSVLTLARTGTVIFADAEYLHGALATKKRPDAGVWKYAVQIGAVKYAKGSKVETFSALISPANLQLTGNKEGVTLDEEGWTFFEQLTALKRSDLVEKGKPFTEVWSQFTNFIGNNPIVIMVGDKEVYKWTHKLQGTPKDDEIDTMEWIRLKPLLNEKGVELSGLDSGQLYERVGLAKEDVCPGLAGHDALFDACSMALFCTKFEIKNA